MMEKNINNKKLYLNVCHAGIFPPGELIVTHLPYTFLILALNYLWDGIFVIRGQKAALTLL